jgi:predicted dehydrogenase
VDIALDFVRDGVPVLIEKPLAIDLSTAILLRSAAQRFGALMTMASKFRYVEDVVRAKALITSGMLGEVLHCDITFSGRVDFRQRWNNNPKISGGGVLIDNGTHAVDIVRFLLGPIGHVHVVEPPANRAHSVEDTVMVFLRTDTGSSATVDLSWVMHKPRETFIDIYGPAGTLQIGWSLSRYRLHTGSGWVEIGPGYNKLQAFQRQLRNFCSAARNQEPLLIQDSDAIASVAAIQAGYRSLACGGWQEVEKPELHSNGEEEGSDGGAP